MRQIDPYVIDSSISPVIQSSGNVAESTPENKELAEKEEIVMLDDTLVPVMRKRLGNPGWAEGRRRPPRPR